ncbi:helix-turn-helix domain-containing protein [Mucilaginibacter sp. UR6-11]|uniref:helix-turn-helix domain-containing protein n=1 Tax=Mucilaginibacter sp. UR6-11 TaxID=1435644 RepID=UPI001E4574DA|nr:helix-turn-helix domain-containing protein [Mucilaginibacter sp. UR6-11]MCC8426585.1 helix-turn-helix domain-containing protein [Mucilaginibacter sp. UR6-11]
MLEQIQIISTPAGLQDYINSAVKHAFDNLAMFPNSKPIESPLSVKELCDFLGVTEPTVSRWRNKGKIPYMQIGSRILFNKSAVLDALENKKK